VWSFAPPEDVLYERGPTTAQRLLEDSPTAPRARPLSAAEYRTNPKEDQQMTGISTHEVVYPQDDIDMSDAGPSTAPPHATGPTFFHDDD
jgi:F-box and WD-40 domain protein CDC4